MHVYRERSELKDKYTSRDAGKRAVSDFGQRDQRTFPLPPTSHLVHSVPSFKRAQCINNTLHRCRDDFRWSFDSRCVQVLYVHTLHGALLLCYASAAFSNTPARTKAVPAYMSSCIQDSDCSFSAVSLLFSNFLCFSGLSEMRDRSAQRVPLCAASALAGL